MIKFEYHPWKKIFVHEFGFETFESLKKDILATTPMGNRTEPYRWCNGFLLVVIGFIPTPDLIKKEVNGEAHWRYVSICPFPKYVDYVEISEGKITIPILDVSGNPVYTAFLDWVLKNREKAITMRSRAEIPK
jgi:hypothetical protein